jgi:hypothetical protein
MTAPFSWKLPDAWPRTPILAEHAEIAEAVRDGELNRSLETIPVARND